MKNLIPDLEDRETVTTLLLVAEILTKRGERGPLSRILACRPRRARSVRVDDVRPDDADLSMRLKDRELK